MEKTKNTAKKNQRIILRKYELVQAQVILDKETHIVKAYALKFKQLSCSPASSLFTKTYQVRVNEENVEKEVLLNMTRKPIIIDGYIKDGHLHFVQKLDEYEPIDLSEYEELGSFCYYKPADETEQVEDAIEFYDLSHAQVY